MDGYSINKTEFGERIKSAREELKMTQAQFAQLLKTSQTTVAKYEHGEQIPRADVLAAISKATGKSADWLLFGEQQHSEDTPQINGTIWLSYFVDLLLDPPNGFYDHEVADGTIARNRPYKLIEFGTRPLQDDNDCGVSFGLYGPETYNLFNMVEQIKHLNEGFTQELIDSVKKNICDKYGNLFRTREVQYAETPAPPEEKYEIADEFPF